MRLAGALPKFVSCPNCQHKINLTKGTTFDYDGSDLLEKQEGPLAKLDTFTICFNCARLLFIDLNAHVKLAGLEESGLVTFDTDLLKQIEAYIRRSCDTETEAQYIAAVYFMSIRFHCWMVDNPGAEITIEYNFPPEVFVAGTLADAIDKKLVTLKGDAERMLQDTRMSSRHPSSPTINMLRTALEWTPLSQQDGVS